MSLSVPYSLEYPLEVPDIGRLSLSLQHDEDSGYWDVPLDQYIDKSLEITAQQQLDETIHRMQSVFRMMDAPDDNDDSNEQEDEPPTKKRKKKRRSKRYPMFRDDDGNQRRLFPRMTRWYNDYVAHPQLDDPAFRPRFRKRFRMPYDQFVELHSELEEVELFKQWHDGKTDAMKNPAAPISLLVLCSLRYLGRGWTFVDLYELCEYDNDRDRNVITRPYKGMWLVVNNGYLEWAVTVPPMKVSTDRAKIRFSQSLESMRKDVECTFGILKGRF